MKSVHNTIDFDMFLIREYVKIHEGILAWEIYVFPTQNIEYIFKEGKRAYFFTFF